MAEGYVVRRSGSGGDIASLNIFNGVSGPPQDKVGVYINQSSSYDNGLKYYVIPNGLYGSNMIWETGYNPTPVKAHCSSPAINGNTVYLYYQSNGLYAHNTNTDIYSYLGEASNTQIHNGSSTAMCYDNGIVYAKTANTSTYTYIYEYSISSNVWSQTNHSLGGYALSFYGAHLYNQNIYWIYAYGYSGDYDRRIVAWNVETETSSIFHRASGNYGTQNSATVLVDNMLYCFGGNTSQQWAVACDLYASTAMNFKTPYSSSANNARVLCGFYANNKIYGLVSARLDLISYELPVTSTATSWETETQNSPPMYPVNNYNQSVCAYSNGKVWCYNLGATGVDVMTYNVISDEYSDNSFIIECGTTTNVADIITSEDNNVSINVKKVYYISSQASGGNMMDVTSYSYVRVTGGEWTLIQS